MNVETCVAPAENLLDKGKSDELFPKQKREDLSGEESLDEVIMEAGDTVESAIRGCASFGNQYMDMRMGIDAISEGLDDGLFLQFSSSQDLDKSGKEYLDGHGGYV